ncbi:TonB-dependent receptor [uncultured Pseudoteredinibacter sp.]|uniref:TonB-dependent receptor n=1 Tax=uncultured Pseudoteredinibacter sp. TaxID=1641701 RepID=UPI00260C0497|nr:TonB-dependent receptor [uncultured Pseudoteredinibacter sp.]
MAADSARYITNSLLIKIGLLFILAASLRSGLLLAQGKDGLVLEEVVVTAQKRPQNSLDVPITINTFSADDIANVGARSIVDIHRYIPGLEVSEKELTQTEVSIRGIKGTNISTGGDPSVATFFDGSYIPRAATTISFSDIERIEVLKGPQGTLFGRNAAAGVVNIIPNAPDAGNYGFVTARLGNLNLRRLEAMANVTLSDGVYLRVNALSNQRDGVLNNIGEGGDPGGQDNSAARAALLWEVADGHRLSMSYDWDKIDQSAPQSIGIGPFANNTNPFVGPVNNDVRNGGEKRDMQAFGIKYEYAISEAAALKFLSSYREFETANRLDDDGTADISRYIDTDNIEDSDIFYSEIQLNYNADQFTLVAGLNYSQEDIQQIIPVTLSTDAFMSFQAGPAILNLGGEDLWDPEFWSAFSSEFTGGTPLDQSQESYSFVIDVLRNAIDPNIPPHFFAPATSGDLYTESIFNKGDFKNYGVYADIDYQLSEKLNVAFGLRYSEDKKSFSWYIPLSDYAQDNPDLQLYNLFFGQVDLTQASKKWSKLTGRILANYRITEESIVYGSYSTGYKSGGYDSLEVATAQLPIAPEDVKNLELGVKGDYFDGNLRVQLSFYDLQVDGSQRTILGQRPQDAGVIYYIINGDTHNKGIELQLDWLITQNLKFGLSTFYARNSSQFDDYYNALAELIESQEVKQNFSFADNYTVQLDWYPNSGIGDVRVHLDYTFNADTLRGTPDFLEEFSAVPAYGEDRESLNAQLSWFDDSRVLEISIWGRNLSDNKRVTNIGGLGINTINAPVASIDDPRTYGLSLKYNF